MQTQTIPESLPSFACGSWVPAGKNPFPIFHAVTGQQISSVSTEGIDFAQMLAWSQRGGKSLRALTFHERALRLKALAQYLMDRKEQLYAVSWPTGATRSDAWIDIEGGIGTLFTYASKGRRELPAQTFYIDGDPEAISKNNTFTAQHICVPLEGTAVHINAFNFPCWGMLEKLAPTFLAGMPAIVKPASSTSYVAQKLVQLILESELLPAGALQIVCGSIGNLFEHLTCQDVVTLTGSKATGSKLKQHPAILEHSIRFNLEADSLNCSILGPSASPGSEEFALFVKEVVREISVKAGQKCTAIRRIIAPAAYEAELIKQVSAQLQKVVVGDPQAKGVKMGPLVSREQATDVAAKVENLLKVCEKIIGDTGAFTVTGADKNAGAFFAPTLLRCNDAADSSPVHSVEAFGPVSSILSYRTLDEAIHLARMGQGSLCASVFTPDDTEAKRLALGIAPYHGRILLMNAACAKESTGHGSPLPHLVHGGPGRAGGGEELGGIRSVMHYLQRTALQGSPQRLTAVTNQWVRGADCLQDVVHPFRKHFEVLRIGESFLSHGRTVTEADIVNFAGISGDHFYAHVDDVSARESIFKGRVAHGYLVLAIAAGLFVDPAPGPVLANYGLERLRFIKPVYPGDTIRVRLTCKAKTPKDARPEGVVEWDVDVTNQLNESVAIYSILTLVRRRTGP